MSRVSTIYVGYSPGEIYKYTYLRTVTAARLDSCLLCLCTHLAMRVGGPSTIGTHSRCCTAGLFFARHKLRWGVAIRHLFGWLQTPPGISGSTRRERAIGVWDGQRR